MVRGIEKQPVHPVHRGGNLLNVKHIRHDDLSAQGPQPVSAPIVAMHQGPSRHALFQQLGGDRAADLARGAGYQYACVGHRSFLPLSDDHNVTAGYIRQCAFGCDHCQHVGLRGIVKA